MWGAIAKRMRRIFVVVLACALATAGPVAGAAGDASVRLTAADSTVAVGDETTVTVVADGLSDGVGSIELGVDVRDPNVVEATTVTVLGSPDIEEVDKSDGRVTVDAIGLNRSGPEAVLVRIRAVGRDPGRTNLSLTIDALGNRSGSAYDVTLVEATAAVTVEDTAPGGGASGRGGGGDQGDGDASDSNTDGVDTPDSNTDGVDTPDSDTDGSDSAGVGTTGVPSPTATDPATPAAGTATPASATGTEPGTPAEVEEVGGFAVPDPAWIGGVAVAGVVGLYLLRRRGLV